MSMKILFISHLLPYPLRMGAALRNHGEIKELSRNNILDVITFSQKILVPTEDDIKRSLDETKKICRDVTVFPIPTDSSKIFWYALLLFNVFSPNPYSAWRFWSCRMAKLIAEQCAKEKYDLVHIDTIALAGYYKYCGDANLVLNHHNVESAILFRRAAADTRFAAKAYLYFQAWKVARYEKKMARMFDLNVCVSELDAAKLEAQIPGIKTFVVPNGTDTNFFHPIDQGNENKEGLVFVGGMNWFPNLDGIVWFCKEVYPLIKEKIPNIHISIIGSSRGQAALGQELRKCTQADSSIRILGVVDDIRPHVAKSKVFVVPLRVGGGTRLKILDAMASGKAIVSTTIGAEGLSVSSGKDIVIADSARDFADSVVQLYSDSDMRHTVESLARETVDSLYSWRVIGPAQDRAYRDLVQGA